MRSDFEKLPQIESHLHNVVFDEGSNEYLTKKMGHLPFEFSEWFLNGAWSAYQHRQTELDELQNKINAAIKIIQIAKGGSDQAISSSKLYEAINELEQALKGESND